MARMLTADEQELWRRTQAMVRQTVQQVMAVVNAGRYGHVIADSEVQVNELMNDLKGRVYQEAVQARIDATEASFPPSGRSDGQASEQ